MSEGLEYVSTKLPVFSHKKDWPLWSEAFLSRAHAKGYYDLLKGADVTVPVTDKDKPSDEDKKLMKLNSIAYGDMICAVNMSKEAGKVAFSIIQSTKDDDYKHGNARADFEKLEKKYDPKTNPTLSRIHEEFYSTQMKKGQDPDVWITHLEDLRAQMATMGSKIETKQFLLLILNRTSREYRIEVALMEPKLGTSDIDCELTVEEVRENCAINMRR